MPFSLPFTANGPDNSQHVRISVNYDILPWQRTRKWHHCRNIV